MFTVLVLFLLFVFGGILVFHIENIAPWTFDKEGLNYKHNWDKERRERDLFLKIHML